MSVEAAEQASKSLGLYRVPQETSEVRREAAGVHQVH